MEPELELLERVRAEFPEHFKPVPAAVRFAIEWTYNTTYGDGYTMESRWVGDEMYDSPEDAAIKWQQMMRHMDHPTCYTYRTIPYYRVEL